MNQVHRGGPQVVRNRVRQGGRRRVIRRSERSESTETAIEYDENERDALDRLSAHFVAKRRFIHPEQPLVHFRIPVSSLTTERESHERKLELDFFKFVALPPADQDPKVKEKLIQGLSEWLERLEFGKKDADDGMAEIDDQVKEIDVRLEFYQKVASVVRQDSKI